MYIGQKFLTWDRHKIGLKYFGVITTLPFLNLATVGQKAVLAYTFVSQKLFSLA